MDPTPNPQISQRLQYCSMRFLDAPCSLSRVIFLSRRDSAASDTVNLLLLGHKPLKYVVKLIKLSFVAYLTYIADGDVGFPHWREWPMNIFQFDILHDIK
ncbi:MAG: hypothetical protein VSS75_020245 [Candidatus Parabeggiatoa sp.]|nr:hypothetical protein [Candidatus Parabeggiatoa sp.]